MVETLSKFTLGLEYTKSSSNTAEDEVLHRSSTPSYRVLLILWRMLVRLCTNPVVKPKHSSLSWP